MSLLIDRMKEYGIFGTFDILIKKVIRKINPFYVKYCPFKVKQNKIIFSNFSGLGYGNDPKYIAEVLKEYNDLDLIWIVRDKDVNGIPDNIRKVKIGTIKYFYEMSTAKVWVDNERKAYEIRKRKGQYYLQVWHGFIPLKKIEKDAEKVLPKQYIKDAINDSKMIDLIPSSCVTRTKIYRESFWYDGEIAECGSPRLDILINKNDTKMKIYEKLGLDLQKKIVVYAPTFRNSHSLEAYTIDFAKIKNVLESRFGGEYVCVVRLHPGMKNIGIDDFFGEGVLDGSIIAEAQELFGACDVLISDYSDSLFEAAVAEKKVFIFATDIDMYLKERDLYVDFNKLPFDIAKNNKELEDNILLFDENKYRKRMDEFWEKQGLYKVGNSAQFLAEWILEKVNLK